MKTLFAALALTFGAVQSAEAHRHQWVDLQVIDRDTGRVLDLFHRHDRAYIAGEPGHRYSVHLVNRSGERVLAVLSVDGVNAVTGQTAQPHQGGYVLGPYERTEVHGWRKSLNEVAQFVFSAPEASYATRTGRPDNVGVIGIAVFRERAPVYIERRRYEQPLGRGSAAQEAEALADRSMPAPSAGAAAPMSKRHEEYASELGTGHGQREWSQVSTTQFERRSAQPDEIVELQYDTYEHLVDRGVIRVRRHRHEEPRAFAQGFVPDPY